QAERAIANLEAILAAAGSGLGNLVKVTVFLADIADWPAVNEVYARLIPEPFPARSAFAVKDLPRGARVEIEAVAAADLG
ncbi:MAG TPA: Rid family hydrolase, partial [Candidatus Limnocylindria bacterium]